MLATPSNVVVVVVVVAAVIITVDIVPIAVVAMVFMLRSPLVLLPRRLDVACCFASVTGIFVACPSFG